MGQWALYIISPRGKPALTSWCFWIPVRGIGGSGQWSSTRTGHGQDCLVGKGYLWLQTSLLILCLSFPLGPALSHPLRRPAPSVPGTPELAQKIQMYLCTEAIKVANDLPPSISVEFCMPCAFIRHKLFWSIESRKITFSKGRFSWSLMVEF